MLTRIRNFFSRVKSLLTEPHGIVQLGWTIESPRSLTKFLQELPLLVPENSILYIDMLHTREVQEYAELHEVVGTLIFPRGWSNRTATFPHLPVSSEILVGLATLCESRHPAEITSQMIVYQGQDVLLTWHDVPDDPIYVSRRIAEENVRRFCSVAGCNYSKEGAPDS